MIRWLNVKKVHFFVWYAMRVLGFHHVVLTHDGTETELRAILFSHDRELKDDYVKATENNYEKSYE